MPGAAVAPRAMGAAQVNPAVARALMARRAGALGAGVPAGAGMGAGPGTMTGAGTVPVRPGGFASGGRTNGEKWVSPHGVEDETRPDKSRGKPVLEENIDHDEAKKGGHITAAQRRALPSSDFALPGKGEGPEGKGSGSYPIDTPGRARSALSRSEQHASPSQEATVRRKVKAKYPDMEVSE